MKTIEIYEHPLVGDAMAILRNKESNKNEFRIAAAIISEFLAVEVTKDILPAKVIKVETPLEQATVSVIDNNKKVILVPILRSGLAMLPMFQKIIPNYDIGFVGQKRDEITAAPREYYCNIPMNSEKSNIGHALILDPMIATGGSAVATIKILVKKYKIMPEKIYLAAIVAAPEGLKLLNDVFPQITVIVAAIDNGLNDRKFIVPGLGDFGDRYYGSEDVENIR